jgi:predicted GNAT superfamily acetyltransferase
MACFMHKDQLTPRSASDSAHSAIGFMELGKEWLVRNNERPDFLCGHLLTFHCTKQEYKNRSI